MTARMGCISDFTAVAATYTRTFDATRKTCVMTTYVADHGLILHGKLELHLSQHGCAQGVPVPSCQPVRIIKEAHGHLDFANAHAMSTRMRRRINLRADVNGNSILVERHRHVFSRVGREKPESYRSYMCTCARHLCKQTSADPLRRSSCARCSVSSFQVWSSTLAPL